MAARRSDRFLASLKNSGSVTFVTHVHADPDALASMMGLAFLVEEKLRVPTRLTRDGPISRAENRAMVELLGIDLVPVEEVEWAPGEAVVMVDSQPNTGRHNLAGAPPIAAVVDHHDTGGDITGIPFVDVRDSLGATCSIVVSYLREQGLAPSGQLATGMMYGIETELAGYPREAGPADEAALIHIYPLADRDMLARIRNARLPQSYFGGLLQALQNAFVYDKLIISWVDDLPQPELAAEIVDALIRFEEVDWAVCAGVHGRNLILSMRTTAPEARAGELLQKVVGRMGRAGGHDRRAGGNIPLANDTAAAVETTRGELRKRLLKALHIEETRGQRLVKKSEILENLHT
ncbi:MAG: DHH family phosphoesterase [Planctomycetes bacterium]|nr:DHH family phosphoesterase [Planctomycetota bacterium]